MKKRFFISLIFLFLPLFLTASEEPAVLLRGPLPHKGIEYLGVNAIAADYAEYSYSDDLITVYFTWTEIFLSEDWTAADCRIDGLRLREAPGDQQIAAYTDRKGWTVFISFPAASDYLCSFIERFISRQNYFINIARDETGFSFPAIIEVKR